MTVELTAEVNFNVAIPTSREIQDDMTVAMSRSVANVLARARINLSGRFLRTRTGKGLRSVRAKVTATPSEITGTIGSPVFYLRMLERGFPAQVMTTRKKGFRFFAGGHVIRVKSIHHPGVAARPWLRTALEESQDDIVDAFHQVASRFVAG
jgi:hypothetical protein